MAFIYDLADTWNNAGTTFTAIKMNVTDTASNAASLLIDLQTGGVSQFRVSKAGAVTTTGAITTGGSATVNGNVNIAGFANSFNWGSVLTLVGDASDILAQRRATNAQTFRAYNTFTDASNYERGVFDWTTQSNALTIGTQQAGSGTARSLRLSTQGDANLLFVTNSVTRFDVSSLGLRATANLTWTTDNTFDIGASGATRPRNLYMGSWIRMATTTVASLPAAATAGAGARMFVTDASAPVFGSAVVGGGAVTVPVYSTGAAWNVG
jgi:hypothetical protein